jgi:DNA-3-methyladenine glycosylase II
VASRLRFPAARAYAHLRAADPVVGALIEQHGPYRPRPSADAYSALVRMILYQQLAGAAAAAIERRWRALYGDPESVPTPAQILATSDEGFRGAGVSRQKASYLRDLAQHVADGRTVFDGLDVLPDEAVAEHLTSVRGVGEWTAHMFLMFHLGRPDVLPVGDLGVRSGMRVAYGLPETPTPERAREIGAPWAPYRSVGSWYMWRAVETALPLDGGD